MSNLTRSGEETIQGIFQGVADGIRNKLGDSGGKFYPRDMAKAVKSMAPQRGMLSISLDTSNKLTITVTGYNDSDNKYIIPNNICAFTDPITGLNVVSSADTFKTSFLNRFKGSGSMNGKYVVRLVGMEMANVDCPIYASRWDPQEGLEFTESYWEKLSSGSVQTRANFYIERLKLINDTDYVVDRSMISSMSLSHNLQLSHYIRTKSPTGRIEQPEFMFRSSDNSKLLIKPKIIVNSTVNGEEFNYTYYPGLFGPYFKPSGASAQPYDFYKMESNAGYVEISKNRFSIVSFIPTSIFDGTIENPFFDLDSDLSSVGGTYISSLKYADINIYDTMEEIPLYKSFVDAFNAQPPIKTW